MVNQFPFVRIWFFFIIFAISVPTFISPNFWTIKLPTRQVHDLSGVLSLAENEFQDGWLESTINTVSHKTLT